MNQIEIRMDPGFYVASSLEEVLERKKQVDKRLEGKTEFKAETEEFYNHAHDAKGHFTETPGGAKGKSEVRNFGFEDWDSARRDIVLNTVSRLQDKYGIQISVNAQDSDYNIATQVEALAAVDDASPRTIDINPGMKSQAWQDENSPGADTMVSLKLEDIVTHEFGHVLELEYNVTKGSEERLALLAPFKEAQQSYDDMVFGTGKGGAFRELTSKVSHYAGEDIQEGIAEAFLQHELGIQNKYSDHVGMHFNNLIKGGGKR